jgi:hypothetical protein
MSDVRQYRGGIRLTFGLPNYSSITIESTFERPVLVDQGETELDAARIVNQLIADDLVEKLKLARSKYEEMVGFARVGDVKPPALPPPLTGD